MKNITKIKKKVDKVEKKQLSPKNIQFNNNEICSLNDIGICLSSLSINNCPIFSLTSLRNFESIKTFQAKNALIFSFKDANQSKKIENISFEGCPITKYPYYRLMVLLLFNLNENNLKKIDSTPITEEERAIAKNCMNKFSSHNNESSLIQSFLKNGGIIRSIDDLSPEIIRKKISPNIVPPSDAISFPLCLNSNSFSPFFTKKAIRNEIDQKSNKIANTSIEKKICDFQNELRSCQLDVDDIFSEFDLLNSTAPISPLYERIQIVQKRIDDAILKMENIELPNDVSKDLKTAHEFLKAITTIVKKYQSNEQKLQNYLVNLRKSCKAKISTISNSKISQFCQDYLDILKKLISVIKFIKNPKEFSIDFAVSNISKISEINDSFVLPYVKIIEKIFDLSQNLLTSSNPSIKVHVITLYQKVSLYKKMPLLYHFDCILKQVAVIQPCLNPDQDGEASTILSEISKLCKIAKKKEVFEIYSNPTSTRKIIDTIKKYRKSFILDAITFRNTTKFNGQMSETQSIDQKILERTKDVERYIKEFENHIEQNKVTTIYIKDRIYDCSNGKSNNTFNASMIKMKNEEIKQKNLQIERLKELIAKKKSC